MLQGRPVTLPNPANPTPTDNLPDGATVLPDGSVRVPQTPR